MRCTRYDDLERGADDGSVQSMAEIELHLSECPACREMIKSIKRADCLLDRLPELRVQDSLITAIESRLDRIDASVSPWHRHFFDRAREWFDARPWIGYLAPATVAFAVAVLVLVPRFLNDSGYRHPRHSPIDKLELAMNYEIVENLDLFENMDTLSRLDTEEIR